MTPTIYVLTAYGLNHDSPGYRNEPLDRRFLDTDRNYVFFLIDDETPEPLRDKPVLFEKQIDPQLARAGAKHLAEWSFLLMEAEHGFCEYPFFMISSRFYEKNHLLWTDLSTEWDRIFRYLERYGWGYLPSYNHRLRWLDYTYEKQVRVGRRDNFTPFNERSFDIVNELFGVDIPRVPAAWSDMQCNYIGFASREALLEYVDYYRPFFEHFFDEEWELKRDVAPYARTTLGLRNEKPLTYLLEFISHLFFFERDRRLFALHYQGYYEIDERRRRMRRLERGAWNRRPGWLANWYLYTRAIQPLWPHIPDSWQSRLEDSKGRVVDLWERRRRAGAPAP